MCEWIVIWKSETVLVQCFIIEYSFMADHVISWINQVVLYLEAAEFYFSEVTFCAILFGICSIAPLAFEKNTIKTTTGHAAKNAGGR